MPTFYPPVYEKRNNFGEDLIFTALEKCHNLDGYHIFHSLSILTHVNQRSGEADFVVVGPRGVLVIEVKGATSLKIDATGWKFINSSQSYTKGSPFKQAEDNMYSIWEGFQKKHGHHISNFFGYCVAFPNLSFDFETIEYSREIVIDKRDMNNVCNRVNEIIDYFRAKSNLDNSQLLYPNVISDMIQYLRGRFSLLETSRSYCDRTLSIIETASEEQIRIMERMAIVNQLMVNGLPGTGKTLLAKRICRIKSAMGKRVLFICFNKILALDVKAELSRVSRDISVSTFDGLINEILKNYVKPSDIPQDFEVKRIKVAEEISSDSKFIKKYDTIVLDESQDFLTANTLKILDAILVGGLGCGNWFVFYDDKVQDALFGKGELRQSLESLREISRNEVYSLKENFRNPKYILDKTHEFTKLPVPSCTIPSSDLNLEVLYYRRKSDFTDAIVTSLRYLILVLKIKPHKIVILFPEEGQMSYLTDISQSLRQEIPAFNEFIDLRKIDGNSEIMSDFILLEDQIPFSTIHAFKGMESDFVIVAGVENLDTITKTLLYIGMTRTKVKTYLVCNENLAKILRKDVLK